MRIHQTRKRDGEVDVKGVEDQRRQGETRIGRNSTKILLINDKIWVYFLYF